MKSYNQMQISDGGLDEDGEQIIKIQIGDAEEETSAMTLRLKESDWQRVQYAVQSMLAEIQVLNRIRAEVGDLNSEDEHP